jgi:hypothetical protein
MSKFMQRAERRSASSSKPRRSKPIPPPPETTPVAKRTRSLKRSASIGDLQGISDSRPITISDISPDKTLAALKAKQKKLKKKSVSPPSVNLK